MYFINLNPNLIKRTQIKVNYYGLFLKNIVERQS